VTFPVWITLGPWRLHPHLVFELLGYATAVGLVVLLRPRVGDVLRRDQRVIVASAALIGSVAGSWVLAWPSGKTVVGGLIGAIAAVEFAKWRIGVTMRTGDLFVFPACAGMAIGRIGCFLTGLGDDTYGVPTSWVTGVDFGDGVRRHPTQLYDIAFLTLLGAVLFALRGRFTVPGRLFRAFVMAYMAWRLAVDFLKPEPRVALGLSVIQWAALAMLTYYMMRDARAGAPRPAKSGE
jgi:phosphatidylglycerol:prolipoprotein diacylglycerol transferase